MKVKGEWIMKKVVVLSLFIMCLCPTSFAAKILLKGGEQFPPGEIIGIQEKTIIIKSEFGNLTADFSKIDTILFDETANPNAPGIQFKNGDFITGEIDSLKDGVLTIKTKYGICLVHDLELLKSTNFLKNVDQYDYNQEIDSRSLFHLNKYERIYGTLLAIEDNLLVVESEYGTLKIGTNEIEQIQFANSDSLNDLETPKIVLRNQNSLRGAPISFKEGKMHIRAEFGEMVITDSSALSIIVFGENKEVADVIESNISPTSGNTWNISDVSDNLIEPEQIEEWLVGKGQMPRRAEYYFKIPSEIETFLIRIENGADNTGDRAVEVFVFDPQKQRLLYESTKSEGWEVFEVSSTGEGIYQLIIQDLDTNTGGSSPGNGGKFQIVYQ